MQLGSLLFPRREGAGVTLLWPSSTQRGPTRKKDGDRVFSKAFCDGTWGNGFKPKECRCRQGIRMKTSMVRMVRHSKEGAAPCACSLSGGPSASPRGGYNVQSVWEMGLCRPKTNCPRGQGQWWPFSLSRRRPCKDGIS